MKSISAKACFDDFVWEPDNQMIISEKLLTWGGKNQQVMNFLIRNI